MFLDSETLLVSDTEGNLMKITYQNNILEELIIENDVESIDKLINKDEETLKDNRKLLWGLKYLLISNIVFFSSAAILHPMIEGITLNSIIWSLMWILFIVATIIYYPIKRYKLKKEIETIKLRIGKAYELKEQVIKQKCKKNFNQEKMLDRKIDVGYIFKFEDSTKKYDEMLNEVSYFKTKIKKKVLKP